MTPPQAASSHSYSGYDQIEKLSDEPLRLKNAANARQASLDGVATGDFSQTFPQADSLDDLFALPDAQVFEQRNQQLPLASNAKLPSWMLRRPSLAMSIGALSVAFIALYGVYVLSTSTFSMMNSLNSIANEDSQLAGIGDPIGTGAYNFPAVATELEVTNKDGSKELLPIGTSLKVLRQARMGGANQYSFGRTDPFAPLIDPNASEELSLAPVIVESPVAYVGIIKDTLNRSNPHHVAMLQVKGDEKGRTLIKEAGETFELNGIFVQVTAVKDKSVELLIDGEPKTLDLKTYAQVAAENADDTFDNLSAIQRRR